MVTVEAWTLFVSIVFVVVPETCCLAVKVFESERVSQIKNIMSDRCPIMDRRADVPSLLISVSWLEMVD
jgi:hypothetical protein